MLIIRKTFAAGLISSLLLAVPVSMQARDHNRDWKCEQRIHKAEERLRQAERKHGPGSRQAQNRRRQLEEERERCHHRY